jgi:cation:H+ antiporter
VSPWLVFALSAACIIAAGSRLSRDGDTIAERTGLGGAWIGAILVAGATSLPELVTGLSAILQGEPNLAVGDIYGSCMANVLILAVADLATRRVSVFSRVTANQVLVGVLAVVLLATAAAGTVAHEGVALLGIGWGPLLVGVGYVLGMRLLHINRGESAFESEPEHAAHAQKAPPMRHAILGFALAAVAILIAGPFLAGSTTAIAAELGISTGFAGVVLVALTTSLPEVTVSLAAVRAGSYDLAVGNLLGSNCFNAFILLIYDAAEGPGPMLARTDGGLLIAALFAIILTAHAVLAVLNRAEKRVWYLEPDAISLTVLYFLGLFLVYRHGH